MSTESGKKVILVVEDDEQSMRYLQVLLGPNYEVRSANWAESAWNILQEFPIDLVLMDISLPGEENGLQLTRRIRASETFRDIPIVAVTAHAFPRDRENSIAAGCNEYISKPFERMYLLSVVESLLAK
ncbi:MAG: response regulator [Bacteroidota bacterium]